MFGFPWRRRSHDDAGSMPLAMLVTLVSVSLSAGVSGMVIGQLKTSQRAADRVAAVSAAQAGLDFALKTIRSAVNPDGTGLLTALPCDWSGLVPPALPGLSGTTGSAATYSVAVGYFLNDPAKMVNTLTGVDLSQLNALAGSATSVTDLLGQLLPPTTTVTTGLTDALTSAVGCVGGALQQVPLYGLLKATGTVGTSTRMLYATYKFHNVDETIPGGHLTIAGTGGLLCIGDFNATPGVNDTVSAVLCTSDDKQAKFIYPKNLSLALANSRTSSSTGPYPYGLCVSAPTPPVDGARVSFAKCSATSAVSQQWDYDVNKQTYYGASINAGGTIVRSGYCLSVSFIGTVLPASPVVMRTGSNCGTANATGKAFVPDANVGAGGAGTNSGQYVNKAEVGRCLDLTNENPGGSWAASKPLGLIAYPCKQSFVGSVYWNHKWIGPLTAAMIAQGVTSARGQVYTTQPTAPAKNWCLHSPGPTGGYVWVALCDAADGTQMWTVNGATMSTSDSYQVADANGLCLEAAGERGPAYIFSGTISYVITATCDGRPEQKWNSPTEELAGPLKSISEK
jgi:hypothetical protein